MIFDELLKLSKASAQAGAELIVWPETMVQAILEPRVLELVDSNHPYSIFDQALREHSKSTAYLLVGAYSANPEITEDFTIRFAARYNSAYLYRPDGRQSDKYYNKIHLVPFGELMPFKKSAPWLHNLLMKLTPYDFDYSLDAGEQYTVFEMNSGMEGSGVSYKFGVMICYEDAVPVIGRRFALDRQGTKRLDWLVNISNDGWFVRFKRAADGIGADAQVLPSTELAQHTAVCVFRAVENRLAVLRSVNTGVSCLIDSLGRIRDDYIAGSRDFPVKAMQRQGVAGWFVDRMPIDKRTTFFSRNGQWLDFCCAFCLVLLIIILVLGRFYIRKKRGT